MFSIAKWDPLSREKLAYATACFVTEGLISGKCLQSLWRDAVVKDGELIITKQIVYGN
jgi:hypothetical protein